VRVPSEEPLPRAPVYMRPHPCPHPRWPGTALPRAFRWRQGPCSGSGESNLGVDVPTQRVGRQEKRSAQGQCTVRQVNLRLSLAFLAPQLVKAAVEGRLPRGTNIERFRDPDASWSRQSHGLGLDQKLIQSGFYVSSSEGALTPRCQKMRKF
jgi:hypothetical protein